MSAQKLPPWARQVNQQLFWKIMDSHSDPDEIDDLMIIYCDPKPPSNAPADSEWTSINSTTWSVKAPLRLVPQLALIPGVQHITM